MKLHTTTMIAMLFSLGALAQADSTELTTDSIVPLKSTLTIGAVYANNASYYGQKAAESTPYAALAATYRLKNGLYLSGSTYKLLNDKTSTLSAATLGLGFGFTVAKDLTADLNVSHSFYPKLSPLLQAGNANNASAGLTYTKWITVAVTGDMAFGDVNDGFVTGGLSKAINLFSISPKDVITLTPSAEVVAGTQHFYQTYTETQTIRDSVLKRLNPVFGNFPGIGNGNGNANGNGNGNGNNGNGPGTTTTTTTTERTTQFNLLSYNFRLPLAYNRAQYLVEAAYQLSILSKNAGTDAGAANSFVTLSFYYQF